MSVYLTKSILSCMVLLLAIVSMFTMFELFRKTQRKFDLKKLAKLHRGSGYIYILLILYLSYLCLKVMAETRSELTSRGTFHGVFSLFVLVLLFLKICFIRVYKQYYETAKTFGLMIAILTFGMVGTSGGYYFLVSACGTNHAFEKIMENKRKLSLDEHIVIKTDLETINRGKLLFNSKCRACHNPDTEERGNFAPGLKRLFKRSALPVSGLTVNPDNVIKQLKQPMGMMPSFASLQEDEIEAVLAYLNTL